VDENESSEAINWKRSSLAGNGTAVEVARTPKSFLVRKSPESEILIFTPAEWDAFVAGIGNNEFTF
jgi:hypothetical protein